MWVSSLIHTSIHCLSGFLPLIYVNRCCNIEGGCHTTSEDFQNLNYETLLCMLLGILTLVLLLVVSLKVIIHRYFTEPMCPKELREQIVKEKEEVFETIANESVYGFFLTTNKPGWLIALSVMAFQFYVFFFFVQAARKGMLYIVTSYMSVWSSFDKPILFHPSDFSDDKSDFTYSWRCPRNSEECNYLADQTPIGWLCFGVLVSWYFFIFQSWLSILIFCYKSLLLCDM